MYPHRPWLRSLIVRKLQPSEIQAACAARLLTVPSESDLADLAGELPPTQPRGWTLLYDPPSLDFNRWLQEQGLALFWSSRAKPFIDACDRIHVYPEMRAAFDQIYILEQSVEIAWRRLPERFLPVIIPPLHVFEVYVQTFFDVRSLSMEEMRAWSKRALQDKSTVVDHAIALAGNAIDAYAATGLARRIEDMAICDATIALYQQQLHMCLKGNRQLTGPEMSGIAVLGKQTENMMRYRKEVQPGGAKAIRDAKRQLGDIKLARKAERLRKQNNS